VTTVGDALIHCFHTAIMFQQSTEVFLADNLPNAHFNIPKNGIAFLIDYLYIGILRDNLLFDK
jgi:hypothetical protein